MIILSGQKLVDAVRERCDKLKKRLWIASPFIGDWNSVRLVLGREWVDDENVEVRLITDIANINQIAYKTVGHFLQKGNVRSLHGLHAKIYILDDDAVITSANLTGAAFFRRFEAGVWLSASCAPGVVSLYHQWWEERADRFPADFTPKLSSHRAEVVKEEVCGTYLTRLWKAPSDPGDPYAGLDSEFRDYALFLRCYRDFAGIYSQIQRLWADSPVYFETDAFLNYLFHEAPGKPSKKYRRVKPRRLDADSREKEIRRYAEMFERVSFGEPSDADSPQWRLKRARVIESKLTRTRIMNISKDDVKDVVECLHCMNSNALNKTRFLNPKNNKLESIAKAWNDLLHGGGLLETRMSECHKKLRWFGRSSIQELVGFFYPNQYPLRNSNSNAGLRFFGYDVPVY